MVLEVMGCGQQNFYCWGKMGGCGRWHSFFWQADQEMMGGLELDLKKRVIAQN